MSALVVIRYFYKKMITKLDSLTDISTEFDKTLTSAQKMSWYYDNKNPASPVQPVMGGGELRIG